MKELKNNFPKNKIITIGIMVLVSLICVLVGFIIFSRNSSTDNIPQNTSNVLIDTSATKNSGSLVEKENKTPMFTATGYYDVDADSTTVMHLVNNPENAGDPYVYLQYSIYEIKDDKTSEETPIFQTGLIEPGLQVNFIPCDYFEPGEHRVRIFEQPYTLENGTYVPRFSCDQFITITIAGEAAMDETVLETSATEINNM